MPQLRELRKHGREENERHGAQQRPIVDDEHRLAAGDGLDFAFAAEQRVAPDDQAQRGARDQAHEVQEVGADFALREAVHARDDAGACQERAEDGQEEREANQEHVPHLEHVPALLNHGGVHVRRRGEPRQTGGVFHRIPGPVATPAQLFVRPAHAEHVADGQKQEREQHPLARGDDPFVVEPAGYQRGHAERKRYRAPDEARVQRRRVDDHPVVLQQRVQALAVGPRTGDVGLERVGAEEHQHRKKTDDHHQRGDHERL